MLTAGDRRGADPGGPVRLKRVYEPAADDDVARVQVERLWSRGVRKAAVERWEHDIASSSELRKGYGHDPARWREFRALLRRVARPRGGLDRLRALARSGPLTLVFAARDPDRSSAAVLREVLLG